MSLKDTTEQLYSPASASDVPGSRQPDSGWAQKGRLADSTRIITRDSGEETDMTTNREELLR